MTLLHPAMLLALALGETLSTIACLLLKPDASMLLLGIVATLGGSLLGLCILYTIACAIDLIEGFLHGRPTWPTCERCNADDPTHVRSDSPLIVVMRCNCNRRFVRRGRQCLEVLPGGATRPFRRWHPLRGWLDESGAIPPSVETPYRSKRLDP